MKWHQRRSRGIDRQLAHFASNWGMGLTAIMGIKGIMAITEGAE